MNTETLKFEPNGASSPLPDVDACFHEDKSGCQAHYHPTETHKVSSTEDLDHTIYVGKLEEIATRITFFIAGFGTAAWAPLVPMVKLRLAIDEGMLGLLLLCLGSGSIFTMPIAGSLVQRYGCRRVIIAASLIVGIALPSLAWVSNIPALALTLFIFGAGIGTLSCAANIQAVIVERASGRTMMSGFHGLYSLGGILGALGVSALLWLGMSAILATLTITVVIFVSSYKARTGLLEIGSRRTGPSFALPRGAILYIGLLCFVVFLAEGAMLDWSGVFLVDVLAVSPSQAGLGYAAFAFTMTCGRLGGDFIVHHIGGRKVVLLGAFFSASGMIVITFAVDTWIALVGFAFVGIGCSNIVPIMYSEAGKRKDIAESVAIPAISTMGYSGVLLGPALIGLVAHATHLKTAFFLLAMLLICVSAGTKVLHK